MGRMQLGRFANRAEALAFLVEKYPLRDEERKQLDPDERDEAQYSVRERAGHAAVAFRYSRQLSDGRWALAQRTGSGADLAEAIGDLFKQLGESIDAQEEEDPDA